MKITKEQLRKMIKEESAVIKEGDFVGHHAEIDGKMYVDSNFLNSVRKIRDTFPSELKSMGFGEFYLVTPKGKVQFDRSRGQSVQGTIPSFVGRAHQLYGEPPELAAHEREAIRKWELSARLDSTLLAEIYGAAADLSAAGATVSSLVEEALRLYLPRLRARYNEGHNFTPRGPRPRNRRGISSLPVAEGTPGERPPTSASASASVDDEAWNQGGGVPRPR